MNLTDKHKALLLTCLIAGTIVLSLYSFHIKRQTNLIAESYYELEPEDVLDKPEEDDLTQNENNNNSETNKAYNKASNNRFSKAYQPIEPPKDYEYKHPESS